MKLRIQDNSLRLRLTRPEVEQLARSGEVSASTGFPGDRSFRYTVLGASATTRVTASFDSHAVSVTIPEDVVRDWAGSEQVSISGSETLAEGQLEILVEKDFACLAPREDEDASEMFPHPRAGQESC
jgi:hypothetical protein